MLASKKCPTLALFLFAALLAPATASAQFGPDQTYLGAHLGVSGVGSAAAIGVSADVSYDENISIGGWLDTWSYGERFTYPGDGGGSWDVRYVALAATGSYHFPVEDNPKLDPFVGVALGYYIVSSSSSVAGFDYSGSSSRLFVGAYGGARYFFRPDLAGVARVGFGSAYLTLGVDLKM
jgi:hypothetical protein